ncbi:hypothetical protein C8J57DRAFT_1527953 [Mycena rebaudengoi]|nr:hypothetical protein C8J57DRAFT_1527953 [Mycena rebaudengoi]
MSEGSLTRVFHLNAYWSPSDIASLTPLAELDVLRSLNVPIGKFLPNRDKDRGTRLLAQISKSGKVTNNSGTDVEKGTYLDGFYVDTRPAPDSVSDTRVVRPPNAFMCSRSELALRKKSNASKLTPSSVTVPQPDIGCLAGLSWNQMNDDEKRPYFHKAIDLKKHGLLHPVLRHRLSSGKARPNFPASSIAPAASVCGTSIADPRFVETPPDDHGIYSDPTEVGYSQATADIHASRERSDLWMLSAPICPGFLSEGLDHTDDTSAPRFTGVGSPDPVCTGEGAVDTATYAVNDERVPYEDHDYLAATNTTSPVAVVPSCEFDSFALPPLPSLQGSLAWDFGVTELAMHLDDPACFGWDGGGATDVFAPASSCSIEVDGAPAGTFEVQQHSTEKHCDDGYVSPGQLPDVSFDLYCEPSYVKPPLGFPPSGYCKGMGTLDLSGEDYACIQNGHGIYSLHEDPLGSTMLEAAATSAWDGGDYACQTDWSHLVLSDGDCSDEMPRPPTETLPPANLFSDDNAAHNHSSHQLFDRQDELGLATASSDAYTVRPPYPGRLEWPSPIEVDAGQRLDEGVSQSLLPLVPQFIGLFNKGDVCGWNFDPMQLDADRSAVYDVDVTARNTPHANDDCAPSFDLGANLFRPSEPEPFKSIGVLESHLGDSAFGAAAAHLDEGVDTGLRVRSGMNVVYGGPDDSVAPSWVDMLYPRVEPATLFETSVTGAYLGASVPVTIPHAFLEPFPASCEDGCSCDVIPRITRTDVHRRGSRDEEINSYVAF